ncbi:putative non-specific serine/threonine protein kinase [Helianthus anomalus]
MTEVLKALQELDVCWKKIGHYNMKCRRAPGNNSMQSNPYFGDELSIVEIDGALTTPNVLKFEVQGTVLCSVCTIESRCFCRLITQRERRLYGHERVLTALNGSLFFISC